MEIEREKYRKNLENELKKLEQLNQEDIQIFDESWNELFQKFINSFEISFKIYRFEITERFKLR